MVDIGHQGDDRHVEVHRDVIGSVIISGDGNKVFIHYGLARSQEQAVQPQPAALGPNPYRGLAAFQVEDADVYFGREPQIDRLWHRLRDLHEQATNPEPPIRLLTILGPSGSGKSSLARAGLLPELARRPLPAHKDTRVVVMKPGSSPLEDLALVLARIATNDPSPVKKAEEFEDSLRRKSNNRTYSGLKRIAKSLPGIDVSPLVILVDQFEETYSLCKKADERGAFIDNLIEAARAPEARVSVVITLRSDFLGQTQQHLLLNQVIGSDQSVIVPAMTPDELRRAIAEPARRAGHPLDDATIDLLIEQTKGREGALPMLQFALTRIWEGLEQGKPASETLKAIGGVGGALAKEAQRIYDEQLDDQEKEIAQRVFVGLVQLGEGTRDTRRRVKVASLRAAQDDPQKVQKVLDRFSFRGTRLITLSSDEGQEVAEITHEALFDHWEQINQWLDGRRDLIRQQRRVEAAAEEWSLQSKAKDYLLQGKPLTEAKALQKKKAEILMLSKLAEEFIQKSIQRRRNNRFKSSILLMPLVITVLVVVIPYAISVWTSLLWKIVQAAEGKAYSIKRNQALAELVWWQYSLVGKNFSAFDLHGADLSKANLRNAYFISSNLSGTNLSGADLSRANLSRANLSDADLSDADLSYADLSKANLRSTNLSRVNLSGTNLRSTNLSRVNLSGTNLSDADLSDTDLSRANLSSINLSYANLSYADLSGINLSGFDLSYADLEGTNLREANLREANLRGADLSDADLRGADLSDTNLSDADLRGADLTYAQSLSKNQLSKAYLCQTKPPEGINLDPDRDCNRVPPGRPLPSIPPFAPSR